MKAVTWQGFRDIQVEEVVDPVIKEPNDANIKVTSTNICGSQTSCPFGPTMTPSAWTTLLLTGCRSPMLRRRTRCSSAGPTARSRSCSSRGHDPVVIIQ